ncbi:MAG: alpha-N-acetylglucosaminidase TIM-barrel domain-containing protein [Odoribacter sp.]
MHLWVLYALLELERWEKEIGMALHGINMPLALVGYEAIISRV